MPFLKKAGPLATLLLYNDKKKDKIRGVSLDSPLLSVRYTHSLFAQQDYLTVSVYDCSVSSLNRAERLVMVFVISDTDFSISL